MTGSLNFPSVDYVSGPSGQSRRGESRHSMLTAARLEWKPANVEGGEVFVEEEVLRRVVLEKSKSARLPLEI